MLKCPACGADGSNGPVFDLYSGRDAYYPGGLSIRCSVGMVDFGRGRERCYFEVNVKREDLIALVVGSEADRIAKAEKAAKDRADMERVRYELRRDTTRREPGEFVIARVGFSGAQYLTNLGRWSDASEAKAALASYLQSQGLAA